MGDDFIGAEQEQLFVKLLYSSDFDNPCALHADLAKAC